MIDVILATILQAPNIVELNMIGKNSDVTKKHKLKALATPDFVSNIQITIVHVLSGLTKIRPSPKNPPTANDKNKVVFDPRDFAINPEDKIMIASAILEMMIFTNKLPGMYFR